jgi:hypothetical protein
MKEIKWDLKVKIALKEVICETSLKCIQACLEQISKNLDVIYFTMSKWDFI